MSRRKLGLALAATLLLSPFSASARVGGDDWVAVPYDQNGLVLNARSVELKKGKLWIQLQVVNNTGAPVELNPDQLQATTPDGRSVTRDKGVLDHKSTIHQKKTILPGAGEEFAVEYQVGEPDSVSLSLAYGVTVGGKPTAFPAFVVSRPDKAWAKSGYQHKDIAISLVSATPTKKGIEVKLKIDNQNPAPLYIDKNAFKVKLPTGATVDRVKTVFGNTLTMFGSSAEEISLEFNVGNPLEFAIVMDGINQGQLALPDFPVKR